MVSQGHDIPFFNVNAVNIGGADRIGNLGSPHISHLLGHGPGIFLRSQIRHKIDQCRDSLGNGPGGDDDYVLIFRQIPGLLCSHDNVLVVGQNENVLCIYPFYGL